MKTIKKILAAVLFASIVCAQLPVMADEPGEISVYVNGKLVDFGENRPIIKNSRTLAPARAVFGSIGADISWDANTKTVSVELDGRTVKLKIGSKQATYSTSEASKQIPSDAPPEIINDTTYVPLGIIAESLGGQVEWVDSERAAYFTFKNAEQVNEELPLSETAERESTEETGEAPAPDGQAEPGGNADAVGTIGAFDPRSNPDIHEIPGLKFEMSISGLTAAIDDTTEQVDLNLGRYSAKGESVYGYAWQEIYVGSENFVLVGSKLGVITALYSNSKKASIAGITPGMSTIQLNRALGISLPAEAKTVILSEEGLLTIYRNSLENYSVLAVLAQKTGYTRPMPKITTNLFTESTERQLFSLINTERQNRGLTLLESDDSLSLSARAHSEAMADGNYLSSTDKDGKTAFDRMDEAVGAESYEMASESIGRGVVDAIEIYFVWMNERADAANILDNSYSHIGTGVAPCPNDQKMYFTADFIQRVNP